MRFIFIVIFVASLNTVCIGNPLSDEVNKFSYAKDFNSFSDKYLKENDMNNYSLSTSLFDECMALQVMQFIYKRSHARFIRLLKDKQPNINDTKNTS